MILIRYEQQSNSEIFYIKICPVFSCICDFMCFNIYLMKSSDISFQQYLILKLTFRIKIVNKCKRQKMISQSITEPKDANIDQVLLCKIFFIV